MVGFCADAPLAQLAEQLTLNQWVPGSSPGGRTKETTGNHHPKPMYLQGFQLDAVTTLGKAATDAKTPQAGKRRDKSSLLGHRDSVNRPSTP